MPKITIELTNDELEDLLEMVKLHPEKFSNIETAIKGLGLTRYRELKQKYDPGRKRPMAVLSLFEESEELVPCAFNDVLKETKEPFSEDGLTYFPGISDDALKPYRDMCQRCEEKGEVPPAMSEIIKFGIDLLAKLFPEAKS